MNIDFGMVVGLVALLALVVVLVFTIGATQPNIGPRGTRRLTADERLSVFRIRLAEHRARLIVDEAIALQLAPQLLAAQHAQWDAETELRPPTHPRLTLVGPRKKPRREILSLPSRKTA